MSSALAVRVSHGRTLRTPPDTATDRPNYRRRMSSGPPSRVAPQLDYVGFYDKPFLKFERLLETYLSYAPLGFRSFAKAMPLWLRQKLHLPRELRRGLGGQYQKRYVFTEHHESHAASAFFPSPFEEAAILTLHAV